MNHNAEAILRAIKDYIDANPQVRFAQALFNLNINEFADKRDPSKKEFMLRDIYYDTDEKVLRRIYDTNEKP